MRVYNNINEVHVLKPVVSLGIFDGLHRGHQYLIDSVKKAGKEGNRETLIITYWPHPRLVLQSAESNFRMLTTLDEKLWLLEQFGIDHCLVIPFTPDFASLPADDFIRYYLTGDHLPDQIIVGDDHRYGQGGEGNYQHLLASSEMYHFEVRHLESHLDEQLRISSSVIRACLRAGDLTSANRLLGYPFMLMGEVVMGNRLGSTIGFPTANICCCDPLKQLPSDGVYAVRVNRLGSCFDGMLNIGYRPTVGDAEQKSIEVHLFELEEELYGEVLRIHFIRRMRDEMKFSGLEELKNQLVQDRINARGVLAEASAKGFSYLCG